MNNLEITAFTGSGALVLASIGFLWKISKPTERDRILETNNKILEQLAKVVNILEAQSVQSKYLIEQREKDHRRIGGIEEKLQAALIHINHLETAIDKR